jgi:hypothetical protein
MKGMQEWKRVVGKERMGGLFITALRDAFCDTTHKAV